MIFKKRADESLFHKTLKGFERNILPFVTKLGKNYHVEAIRSGMISIIPILLIGSFFLIIFSFPYGSSSSQTFGKFLEAKLGPESKALSIIMLPYRLTYPMMGLFLVIGVTRSLSRSYNLDAHQAVFMSLIAYLISIIGPSYKGVGSAIINTNQFGSVTVFGGIIVSFFSTEIFRACVRFNIMIKMPKSVPQVIAKPFNALIPMLLVIIPCILLFHYLEFNIHEYTTFLFSIFQNLLGKSNYFGVLIIIFLFMILWVAGIHGAAVVGALARPFWLVAIEQNSRLLVELKESNSAALLYAQDGGNILVEPFFQWFVWIGGAGATLGLVLIMIFSARSRYLKSVSYSALVPSIFNINEPVIFGFPLVLNPFLFIPALLTPMILGTVSYLAFYTGMVALPTQTVGWTLPTPIGAYFATLDWRAIILSLVLIFLSGLIWYPFAKLYDRKMTKQEIEAEVYERLAKNKKQGLYFAFEDIQKQVEEEYKSQTLWRKIWGNK
ncbi:PTS sugar transporter subunit IIC [Mycoplasma sp. Ms02]|uniref:PTS sugar transporter subunit IIC n=1 Tax=Mycoplasma sp. Ms02 TaxID=353851 RepID=UPI001C8A3829|nr:PTS transporter subunit EIIC [Mycoplasma sp. Ms02]QZE12310.1 PTS transporter subunit EIIC [Mycoplasma sp. Ms02]